MSGSEQWRGGSCGKSNPPKKDSKGERPAREKGTCQAPEETGKAWVAGPEERKWGKGRLDP